MFTVQRQAPGLIISNSTLSISSYIGTGTFSVPVTFGSHANSISPPLSSNLIVTDWSMVVDARDISVIYNYSVIPPPPPPSVPEPSMISLIGLGVLWVGLALRGRS